MNESNLIISEMVSDMPDICFVNKCKFTFMFNKNSYILNTFLILNKKYICIYLKLKSKHKHIFITWNILNTLQWLVTINVLTNLN